MKPTVYDFTAKTIGGKGTGARGEDEVKNYCETNFGVSFPLRVSCRGLAVRPRE